MSNQSKEYRSFVKLTDRLLSVPRAELQKRLAADRKRAEKNPRKRGPKPKVKQPVSDPASK
jgi:hypothetical protein